MKYCKIYLLGVIMATALFACDKDGDGEHATKDKGTLNFLVRDNFTLGFFAVALNRTGLEKELAQPGPYTLLAPSDDAFRNAGFYSQADVVSTPVADLSKRSAYHILSGEQVLLGKPLGLNQPLTTLSGSTVYLSRVKKGADTISTLNGGRLLKGDTRASNGLLQVIDRLLVPNLFDKVGDALSADVDLVLFYQALKRSGLLADINGAGNYTIYALNNDAMRGEYGYADVTAVEAADPATLKTLLSYHIAKDRKFAQDYFLLAEEGQTSYTETMLDDRTITVQLVNLPNVPNSFTGIMVQGPGNWFGITPLRTDILAGNGVIHVLGQSLR